MKRAEPSTASRSNQKTTAKHRCLEPLLPLSVLALVASTTGCSGTQRTVTIESEPAGALVWLNDREVGRTPVTVPFTFYGTYDVRLEAEGFEPLWTNAEAEPPWWEHPPADLFGEAFGGEVALEWHFELPAAMPTDDAATDRLIGNARQLRATVETGP